jgi:hypothetical protein
MKNIQLFAEEVAPYLRRLWDGSGHEHHWWPERLGGVPRRTTDDPYRPAREEANVR